LKASKKPKEKTIKDNPPSNIVNPYENDKFPLSEEFMPVKNCIKSGRNIYHYNKEERTVSVYTELVHELNKIPDYILADLIAGKYNAYFAKDEKIPPLTDEEITILMKRLQENQLENQQKAR
jgi:hypothetical protein